MAKLCVGFLQTWMILEITLRVRHSIPRPTGQMSQARFEKRMRFGQYFTISIASIGFIVFVTREIFSAHKEGNYYAFESNNKEFFSFLSYSFLALFILMASINILLVFQLREKERSFGLFNDQ